MNNDQAPLKRHQALRACAANSGPLCVRRRPYVPRSAESCSRETNLRRVGTSLRLSRRPQQSKGKAMTLLSLINSLLDSTTTPLVASAHCDLPCGVYDPAQAKIEAQSVKGCMEKYNASSDPDFKVRATIIKEERCELVKHHLWVLWTDYFKVEHLKAFPNLHDLFWMATKSAGEAKKTNDVTVADRLIDEIDAIAEVFWGTKK